MADDAPEYKQHLEAVAQVIADGVRERIAAYDKRQAFDVTKKYDSGMGENAYSMTAEVPAGPGTDAVAQFMVARDRAENKTQADNDLAYAVRKALGFDQEAAVAKLADIPGIAIDMKVETKRAVFADDDEDDDVPKGPPPKIAKIKMVVPETLANLGRERQLGG